MRTGQGPADAAVIETFVVPRYLGLFGDLALQMLLVGDTARLVHLGCRTGYPDRQLSERMTDCHIVGVDASAPAVELARSKQGTLDNVEAEYHVAGEFPTGLETATFSHALSLHPIGNEESRKRLFQEMSRLLYPGGQALVALPLRGSFQEIGDLLREFALKYDKGDFGRLTEEAMSSRATIETLSTELEEAGLDDIDVEIRRTQVSFDGGRAFADDPASQLLILPELQMALGEVDTDEAFNYVYEAIDKYWSEGQFELELNVGCASARKI